MYTLLSVALLFFLTSCNQTNASHRPSYVISKSSETAAEAETVREVPAD